MPGDVLIALAQFAGQTVAGAAITDVWEAVRGRFARLLGRGDTRKTDVAERWLEQTHQQLTTAVGAGLEHAQQAQAQRWAARFADLLDEHPGVEVELRALVNEVAAQLSGTAVSAADHSVAAGRDVQITASSGVTALADVASADDDLVGADSAKDYLKQIGKVPLPNAEQEVELAKRIEAGKRAHGSLQRDEDRGV